MLARLQREDSVDDCTDVDAKADQVLDVRQLFAWQRLEPRGEPLTTQVGPLSIQEDAASDPVQPQDRLFVGRSIIEPPPQNEERVRNDIVGISAVGTATQRVREKRRVVLLVEAAKVRLGRRP